MSAKVLACKACKPHPFQDSIYGEKNRVHTLTRVGDGDKYKYRCTVCRNERSGGNGESANPKKK